MRSLSDPVAPSETEVAAGGVLEELAVFDVGPDGPGRAMAGGGHDGPLRCASSGGAGGVTSTEAVAGEVVAGVSEAGHVPFDDQCNRLGREPAGGDLAVTVSAGTAVRRSDLWR